GGVWGRCSASPGFPRWRVSRECHWPAPPAARGVVASARCRALGALGVSEMEISAGWAEDAFARLGFDQVQEAIAEVLDLQERAGLWAGLVDTERPHPSEVGRAFEWADDPRVPVEEVGPGCPRCHLPCGEEECAGVWVMDPPECDRHSQDVAHELRRIAHVLERRGHVRADRPVPVHTADELVPASPLPAPP